MTEANPGLRAAYGVGADTAAQLLITAGANPHRLHSEAAFAALCGVPEYTDLRPARQAKNITVTAAANHFGVWPTVISRIERGLQRDDTFAETYRQWLQVA
ncbi:transposase IS116/IS110/IS902 family [Mycolicibacterium fortuitum]|uniref:Transposase IS116/IS110/IS902 family n=1 Tax=Mycolicibacterium fortuitum TaxID=1766 RepID=A0A378WF12_MYCFO|nr:transposase IS116/IS110/IS902 family [Mycolicibacterium fortuitum]